MKFYYGFTVIEEGSRENLPGGKWKEKILHFVGFENPPSKKDYDHIIEELEHDPDFAHLKDYKWNLRESTFEEVDYFQNLMDEADENDDITIRIDEHKENPSKLTRH